MSHFLKHASWMLEKKIYQMLLIRVSNWLGQMLRCVVEAHSPRFDAYHWLNNLDLYTVCTLVRPFLVL